MQGLERGYIASVRHCSAKAMRFFDDFHYAVWRARTARTISLFGVLD